MKNKPNYGMIFVGWVLVIGLGWVILSSESSVLAKVIFSGFLLLFGGILIQVTRFELSSKQSKEEPSIKEGEEIIDCPKCKGIKTVTITKREGEIIPYLAQCKKCGLSKTFDYIRTCPKCGQNSIFYVNASGSWENKWICENCNAYSMGER